MAHTLLVQPINYEGIPMSAGQREYGARSSRWRRAAVVIGAAALAVACSPSEPDSDTASSPTSSISPTTTTTTSLSPAPATPALVPSAGGNDLLLKRGELAEIIGDTDLTEKHAYTEPQLLAGNIDPYACRYRAIVSSGGVSARMPAVTGNVNRGTNGQSANQAVAIFQNQADLDFGLSTLEHQWGQCPDGDIFFIEVDSTNQRWVPYPVSNESGRVGTTIKRDGLPRNCHHIAVGKANVLVESMVCGDGDTAPAANTIADRILARIPG